MKNDEDYSIIFQNIKACINIIAVSDCLNIVTNFCCEVFFIKLNSYFLFITYIAIIILLYMFSQPYIG